MANHPRTKLFVDPKVQGALLRRTVGYWFFCLLTVALLLLSWNMISGPTRPFSAQLVQLWVQYAPALLVSLLLLPVVLIDMIGLSNRFVGPMMRLRRAMGQLADGQRVEPMRFRNSDYWQEFSDQFNRLLDRVEQQSDADEASQDESEELLEAAT